MTHAAPIAHAIRAAAIVAMLSLVARPALAADAPETPKPAQVDAKAVPGDDELSAEVSALIDQLGAADFAARLRATGQLLGGDALPLGALERVLTSRSLSPEARARLLQVARQSFYKSPRAALGVQFDGIDGSRPLPDRVVVGQTFKEFPSHLLLEPGDIIDQADGVKLRGRNSQLILSAIIVSFDPGQSLALVIRRGKDVLNLDVPLGNFSDLQQAGGGAVPADDRISRAWRVRVARLLGDAADPIRVQLGSGRWMPVPPSGDELAGLGMIRTVAAEQPPIVVGGGMPRNAAALEQEQSLIQSVVFVNGQQRIIQQVRPRQFVEEIEAVEPRRTQEEELISLARARGQLREQLRQFGDVDGLPQADALRARSEQTRRAIESLDRQSAAIQAEMAEERRDEPKDDAVPTP